VTAVPRRVALISCTKTKTSYPAPARELYGASPLFRKALAYVEPRVDEVLVLSAKHGLVTLDQPLEPYEQTLKAMGTAERRLWAERVFRQIREHFGGSLEDITFEFHTGTEYRADLEGLLTRAGATCTCPVEGLGIGERMSFYDSGGLVLRAKTQGERRMQPPAGPRASVPAKPEARPRSAPWVRIPFEVVWGRIVAHAGEPFYLIRGGEFHYRVTGHTLHLDRTSQMIPYSQLEQAYQLVPLKNTTSVQHLRAPAYLYAILMDPRIRQSDW